MHRSSLEIQEKYMPYTPKFFDQGNAHPCPIVEAATLGHTSPPPITYELRILKLAKHICEKGILSSIQLEGVVYACQKHRELLPSKHRAGFFLGDSTGLGKGRIIAGILLENRLCGRQTGIWVTISQDLFPDCARDVKSLKIKGFSTVPFNRKPNAVIIPDFDCQTLCVTYSTLKTKYTEKKNTWREIADLLGANFDGPIILDECQKAKGVGKTKIGDMIVEFQNSMPNARIVYVSATAVTIPQEMSYMLRLGLWGPSTTFKNAVEFGDELYKRGVSSMEALAVNLKQRGLYLSRQLSLEKLQHKLIEVKQSADFEKLYNTCVHLFAEILDAMDKLACDKNLFSIYWAAHQTFFANLILSSKIETAAIYGLQKKNEGYSVVYGIQKTGEARFQEVLKSGNASEMFSSASATLENLIQHVFDVDLKEPKYAIVDTPRKKRKISEIDCSATATSEADEICNNSTRSEASLPGTSANKPKLIVTMKRLQNFQLKVTSDTSKGAESDATSTSILQKVFSKPDIQPCVQNILEKFKALKSQLPRNPLDELIYKLGGREKVAELTGRRFRQLDRGGGYSIHCRKTHTTDRGANVQENLEFQLGEKKFAIISDAASTGLSLHSDKSIENSRPRIHITLEVPWSAEKIIQQLGRTHRSFQVVEPIIVFCVSCVPGENRFIWAIYNRLSTMSAITQGDRKAGRSTELTTKLIDTEYGSLALRKLKDCVANVLPFPFRCQYNRVQLDSVLNWITKLKLTMANDGKVSSSKSSIEISKFFNRVLGMPLAEQNILVDLFYKIMENIVSMAITEKEFNGGIMDLTFHKRCRLTVEHVIKIPETKPLLAIYCIQVDVGLSWDALVPIMRVRNEVPKFFSNTSGTTEIIFAYKSGAKYVAYSPYDVQHFLLPEERIKSSYQPIAFNKNTMNLWKTQYDAMEDESCCHSYTKKNCPAAPKLKTRDGECCEFARFHSFMIISGNLNAAWNPICQHANTFTPNIMRCRMSDGTTIVGVTVEGSVGFAEEVKEDIYKIIES